MFEINLQLFGGRGGGGAEGAARSSAPFGAAFQPTSTSSLSQQTEWEKYADSFGAKPTPEEQKILYKSFDARTMEVFGYVQTSNAFRINEKLYDPKNDGKTDEEIFTRKDRDGKLRDLETVRTLDKKISQGKVPKDSVFVRFSGPSAAQSLLGMDSAQAALFNKALSAGRISPEILKGLNNAFKGSRTFSNSYTSTSANRDWNVFKHYKIERRISVPKGTHAYAARDNRVESEVVFGRRMETEVTHITISSSGHIVFHERFIGYRK